MASCTSCNTPSTGCSPRNPCPTYPDAQCIVYTGPALSCINVTTNQRLNSILANINSVICSVSGGIAIEDEGVGLGDADTLNFVGDGVSVEMDGDTAIITIEAEGGVTSVDVDGGSTGMSFTGGPITSSGVITMSGVLDVDNGGTGQTTYEDGELLIGNSVGNTLTKSTLSAGTGISITNGNGSITIDATGGTGTVTSFAFTDGNGFDGTVTNSTTTPTLQLTTTLTNTQVPYISTGGGLNGTNEFVWTNSTNTLSVGSAAGSSNGNIVVSGTSGAGTITGGATLTVETTSLFLETNNVSRLNITSAGAWSLAGSEGSAGQVLTSNGTGTPPTWEDASGTDTNFAITDLTATGDRTHDWNANDLNIFDINTCYIGSGDIINTTNFAVLTTSNLAAAGCSLAQSAGTQASSVTASSGGVFLLFDNGVNVQQAQLKAAVLELREAKLKFSSVVSGETFLPAGTATLSGGTVTVTNNIVGATDKIYVSHNTIGGTPGILSAPSASITANTSFVINSSSGTDTSTVNWFIVAIH